jgi:hypothetical protein
MRWRLVLGLYAFAASMTLISSEPGFSQVALNSQPDPNAANRDITMERYAIGGRKSIFAHYYSLKLDCSLSGWQEVKLSKSPENGEAKLREEMTVINYSAPNPRVKCNGRSTKSMALEYVPTKGYTGSDSIEVELINESGQQIKYTYNITVK